MPRRATAGEVPRRAHSFSPSTGTISIRTLDSYMRPAKVNLTIIKGRHFSRRILAYGVDNTLFSFSYPPVQVDFELFNQATGASYKIFEPGTDLFGAYGGVVLFDIWDDVTAALTLGTYDYEVSYTPAYTFETMSGGANSFDVDADNGSYKTVWTQVGGAPFAAYQADDLFWVSNSSAGAPLAENFGPYRVDSVALPTITTTKMQIVNGPGTDDAGEAGYAFNRITALHTGEKKTFMEGVVSVVIV